MKSKVNWSLFIKINRDMLILFWNIVLLLVVPEADAVFEKIAE